MKFARAFFMSKFNNQECDDLHKVSLACITSQPKGSKACEAHFQAYKDCLKRKQERIFEERRQANMK